jgi:hypothetical protein
MDLETEQRMRRISERTHDLSPAASDPIPRTKISHCAKCRGHGFTGARQAFVENVEGAYFPAIAWRHGVACSCPDGAEFAKNQMLWMELDEPIQELVGPPLPFCPEHETRKTESLQPISEVIADKFGNVGSPEFLQERRRLRNEQIEAEKRKADEIIRRWAAGAEERERKRSAREAAGASEANSGLP